MKKQKSIEANFPIRQLKGEEFDKLLNFVNNNIQNYEKLKRYRITHSRCILSYKREDWETEDRVIDLAIAFESLFDDSHNIVNRISTISGLLLGKTIEEKRDIRDRVREFYDYRSRIVHGDPKRKSKAKYFIGSSIDGNLSYIRSYILSLFRMFLRNPELRNKSVLDDLLLGQEVETVR